MKYVFSVPSALVYPIRYQSLHFGSYWSFRSSLHYLYQRPIPFHVSLLTRPGYLGSVINSVLL